MKIKSKDWSIVSTNPGILCQTLGPKCPHEGPFVNALVPCLLLLVSDETFNVGPGYRNSFSHWVFALQGNSGTPEPPLSLLFSVIEWTAFFDLMFCTDVLPQVQSKVKWLWIEISKTKPEQNFSLYKLVILGIFMVGRKLTKISRESAQARKKKIEWNTK